MARPMRLMEYARERPKAHAKRADGLKKQAEKLATLCGVPVALVCASARAGAPPLVWESEEGVLERMEALGVPADHGHGPGPLGEQYASSRGGDNMLAPGFGNAGYNWPDLTMWHTDEVCFADGTLAPEHYSGEVAAGGDYVSTLPSGYGYPMAMGMDVSDNFTSLESNYTAAHWQAEALHRSNASASTSTSTGELLSAASSPRYLY
ncbi:hypothetical protein TRIUR3_02276 [Triticum urartu]|uniref:Uncharacterized protein n=1 Tax=Triticum urartu TaxID=4572 RepID=M7YIL2_TRIUA|nr:hypothetical protein TRIUR3_02276 [Triticum urartu]